MVQAAEVAAGSAPGRDPALHRLLERCRHESGAEEDALAEDEEFWARQQAVEVARADKLEELPPLPELLERSLQLPQPRGAAALRALALARLQVRSALAAFASHTETLIGEVQQGRIQFRHVDNSIIVVAEALRRLAATGDALERSAGPLPPWLEGEAAARRRLPRPPRGDACYVRCIAEHGVLRRCLQVLKLPALIVDSLVETGSVLSGAERRSLFRRLRSHFVLPLRDFCCGLLATPQGSALLLQQGAPCAEIAAVLAPIEPPSPTDGAANDTSPGSLLSEKLLHLAQAHAAWSAAVVAVPGTSGAQHAAHALLRAATQDRQVCQMLAHTLQHLPEALAWVRRSVAEAAALEAIAANPALATDPAGGGASGPPDALTEPLQRMLRSARPLPYEALLVAPLLAALCSASLPDLPQFWADVLPPLLPLLTAMPACRADMLLAPGEATPASAAAGQHSPVSNPTTRQQHACWLSGCALTFREQRGAGVGAVVGTLNGLLPQLLPGLIHPLPLGLKDWASAEPLCDTAAAPFKRLRTSAAAQGRVAAALSVIAATVADPACAPRAIAFAHEKGAMYVLPRAVAAAVTWIHGAHAAVARAHVLGEARCPLAAVKEAERALALLHEACRAMCAMASALLAQPGQRSVVEKSQRMHGRWRTVCHVLLTAYHAVHRCPDNIQTFTGTCARLTAPLELRHLIAATLQRWVVSGSPICPLQQMLRAGSRAEEPHSVDSLADEAAGGSTAQHVRGWHRPSAMISALALLGDICPPPWPSNEAVHRVRNIDALTFPDLRRAVAASCDSVMADLQALVGAVRLSHSTAALAALVRALPRVASCASFIGNYLLGPLVQDLQAVSAAAAPTRPLAAGRAHSLLAVTVAVALHPLGKETLRGNGLSIVLNDLLHKMVAAWGRDGASEADKAAYRVLCRLTLDALRFLCDYKVTMEPSKPLAQRLQYDMPPKKHLAQVTCGLLECLPFLEGSTGTAAVDLLRLLINAPYDPVVVAAVKAGADAAATAFNEEERRAVGGEAHLALAASSSSTLQYLAEELVRRAERLEAHGSRRNVSAACADAADLLRQCATLPSDPSTKPLEPISAVDRISNAAAHAKAVHDKQAGALGSKAADAALPLDTASALDLFGGPDHEWFLQLFAQRQLPAEANGGVEIVRRTRPRGDALTAILPPALQPPDWPVASAAAEPRVPISNASLMGVARPRPKPAVPQTAQPQAAAATTAAQALGSAGGGKAVPGVAAKASAATDGPFQVPAAKGVLDSGDLYADFAAAEPTTRSSLGSKRRASTRSRVSSDSVSASRTASQPAAAAAATPARPAADTPPKAVVPAATAAPAPSPPKRMHAGLLPASSRSGGSKRLPAGLLPANMPKAATGGASAAKPSPVAPGLPLPPGAAKAGLPPPPGELPPPRDTGPASDLPPPPPIAGQVYSRVPAAHAAPVPPQQAPAPLGAGDLGAAGVPGSATGTAAPAPSAAAPAPAAPSEENLSSILKDPVKINNLLRTDTPAGQFLRQKLQSMLKPKAPG